MYQDNEKKVTVVLNRRHPTGALLNAMGHIVQGLAADIGAQELEITNYTNEGALLSARISKYPVIVLGAKNSNQVRTTYAGALAVGLAANVFTSSMLGRSSAAQVAQTAAAAPDDLDYLAVVIFGTDDDVRPLSKRFSVLTTLA